MNNTTFKNTKRQEKELENEKTKHEMYDHTNEKEDQEFYSNSSSFLNDDGISEHFFTDSFDDSNENNNESSHSNDSTKKTLNTETE